MQHENQRHMANLQDCSRNDAQLRSLALDCLVAWGIHDKNWGSIEGPDLQELTEAEHAKWPCSQ